MIFKVLILVVAMVVHAKGQELITNGVRCDEKEIIIDYHNELRMLVANGSLEDQPKASDMESLVWDDDLALQAQNWADLMVFQYNPDRGDNFGNRFTVGENLYEISTIANNATFDWKSVLDYWLAERVDYDYAPLNDSLRYDVYHYTQFVWANTKYIGCGVTYSIGEDNWFHKLYVCDYGPSGNVMDEYPYTTGEGCDDLCCAEQCNADKYGAACAAN